MAKRYARIGAGNKMSGNSAGVVWIAENGQCRGGWMTLGQGGTGRGGNIVVCSGRGVMVGSTKNPGSIKLITKERGWE